MAHNEEKSLVAQAATGEIVSQDFASNLAKALSTPKELVNEIKATVKTNTSVDDIAAACNLSDDLGVFAWVRSAVLVAAYMTHHNAKSERKQAQQQLQEKLNCGQSYFYRLKQAGKILLSGNYKKLAKSAQDFILENTTATPPAETTAFKVVAKIGEMKPAETIYFIYSADVTKSRETKDDKTDRKYFYTSGTRGDLSGKTLEIITGESDGKPFTKFYDDKKEIEINYIVV